MAKTISQWLDEDVRPVRERSIQWLSEAHFFRDPIRAMYSDSSLFFSPADGIILFQQFVEPSEPIVDIKGKSYSLRDAIRDESYGQPSLVIGVFMTFYDVHVNRIPYAGRLSYKELDRIDTYNYPMLDVERSILEELRVDLSSAGYLRNNQRVLNRVYSTDLRQAYYILQIADYDVDCITPFTLRQNWPYGQNQRFSQIRFGSQVDLIVPVSERYELTPLLDRGMHVEAGVDPLIRVVQHPDDRMDDRRKRRTER